MAEDERREPQGVDSLMGPAFLQNPVPMTITSVESQRFTAANQAFLALCGFYRAEVIGATSEELNLWVRRSARTVIQKELDRTEVVGPALGEMRTKSGEIVKCRYAFRLLSAEGAPSVLSVILPQPWNDESGY